MIPKIKQIETEGPAIRFGEVEGNQAVVSEKPSSLIGGSAARMQAIASYGRENPGAAVHVEGSEKANRVDTKEGRRAVAGKLGLPNKKKK